MLLLKTNYLIAKNPFGEWCIADTDLALMLLYLRNFISVMTHCHKSNSAYNSAQVCPAEGNSVILRPRHYEAILPLFRRAAITGH